MACAASGTSPITPAMALLSSQLHQPPIVCSVPDAPSTSIGIQSRHASRLQPCQHFLCSPRIRITAMNTASWNHEAAAGRWVRR